MPGAAMQLQAALFNCAKDTKQRRQSRLDLLHLPGVPCNCLRHCLVWPCRGRLVPAGMLLLVCLLQPELFASLETA